VLKLALLDLQQAYERESDAAIRARLDRLAMYLHWLRLGMDLDRGARLGSSDELPRLARELSVFSRRIMDTGLIHAFPMLFSEWFNTRFAALKTVKGFDLKQAEAWKKERTDMPPAEEVRAAFAGDLKHLASLDAVEIDNREFGGKLVALAEALPDAVKAWGDVPRSPLVVESGVHYFISRRAEMLRLTFTPFSKDHTVDGHWTLTKPGARGAAAEGDLKAAKGQPAAIELRVPAAGVWSFDPGTSYWKAAQVGFDARPLSVWAGRADSPGRPRGRSFLPWLPRPNEPVYFFVPKGTRHFVVGFPGGGTINAIALRTADGQAVVEQKRLVAGDELSVRVPPGKDGAVWSLAFTGVRVTVELYGVPPFLARHPAELIMPAR
jgi:hypothetical protein